MFQSGDLVLYIPENKIYDFGYYSQTKGKAVIYERGCCNMQDSYAVDIVKLKKIEKGF